jgi:hypothetical protein
MQQADASACRRSLGLDIDTVNVQPLPGKYDGRRRTTDSGAHDQHAFDFHSVSPLFYPSGGQRCLDRQ